MADLILKRNDTRPTLSVPLTEGASGTPINLTTATSVKLMMKTQSGSLITRPATITSAAGGVVSVTFQSADTATSGEYSAEFEITWNDGGKETIPNDGWLTITILDDLG